MIEIANLDVKYNKKIILKNISLVLPNHKIIALVGLNGAGKSTLIKTITTYLKPQRGSISLDGCPLDTIKASQLKELISYVPQKMEYGFRFIVNDFISLAYRKNGSYQLDEILTLFKLHQLKNNYLDELSGGQLRLVYLARAYYQDAKWLLLDEPTANLDFKNEYEFLELLKEINLKKQKSILISIHNPYLAVKYADYIVLLEQGNLKGIYSSSDELLKKELKKIYGQAMTNLDGE